MSGCHHDPVEMVMVMMMMMTTTMTRVVRLPVLVHAHLH